MEKLKYLLCSALFSVFAFSAYALDNAKIITRVKGKVVSEKIQKLEQCPDGAFRAKIPLAEIPANIDTLEIRIPEATALKGNKGYFLLGDGRIGYFTRAKGNLRCTLSPLPIFGLKKADKAVMGIVKGMRNDFDIMVDIEKGKYSLYPQFKFKDRVLKPYEDIVVDFYALEGNKANYAEMGKIYRKYQLERGEVVPLRERVKNRPELAYSVDTMVIRVKHGVKHGGSKIEDHTPENEPKVTVYSTFERLKEIIVELKAMGVEKLDVVSVAWNTKGHDGRYPQLFPVEPAFGGEAKLREAIKAAKDAGYQIYAQTNYTDAYKIADCWSEDYILKNSDGSLNKGGVWSGGRAYRVCQVAMLKRFVDEDFKRMKELGFKGLHHIDVLSAVRPRPCFDPNHLATAQDNAKAMNDIGLKAREYFGGFGSECGVDHVANSLDYALYTSAYPRYCDSRLTDKLTPLWQIVYHGIILSNPHYSTVDYNISRPVQDSKGFPWNLLDDQTRRLKLFEFGGRPSYYWHNYKDLKPIKAAYDEYQPLKYLQYEFMESHDEIAKDIYLVGYSDGSRMVFNYTNEPFTFEGEKVAPKDYILIKPTKN